MPGRPARQAVSLPGVLGKPRPADPGGWDCWCGRDRVIASRGACVAFGFARHAGELPAVPGRPARQAVSLPGVLGKPRPAHSNPISHTT